jgi:phytoene dehydrogenase-like protein
MEDAHAQSRRGQMSDNPFLIIKVPTLADPSMAPEGKHVLSIFGGHAPYTLREGTWDERRDEALCQCASHSGGLFQYPQAHPAFPVC